MRCPGWLSVFTGCILLLVTSPLNASMNAAYRDLRATLNEGGIPDTGTINRLPRPKTPGEFWLKSRVAHDVDTAINLVETAIERTDSATDKRTYFKDWMKISLLKSPETVSGTYFRSSLKQLSNDAVLDGEGWYLAGQLARHLGRLDRADRYFRRIPRESRYYGPALLSRASVALDRDRPDRAADRLDAYFLSPVSGKRPRYWVIRGRYFKMTGADSEAYIAYSHVINHYPESLDRTLAEQQIGSLPLPEALYPKTTSSPNRRSTASRPPRRQPSETVSGRFGIQAGSFRDVQRARQLRQSLKELTDYTVRIRQVTVNNRPYHRVQVVGIPSRDRAADLLSQLSSSGYDGFIVTP